MENIDHELKKYIAELEAIVEGAVMFAEALEEGDPQEAEEHWDAIRAMLSRVDDMYHYLGETI